MAQLRDLEGLLGSASVQLVTVGSGTVEMAARFSAEHDLSWPALTDASGAGFRAAGMRRGLGSLLRLRAVGNGLRALRAGHRQSKVQGDPWQQGGALVFAADGELRHAQRDLGVGDLLDVEALHEVATGGPRG